MPGRNPYQAFQAFVEPLARALSCVARAKLQTQSGGDSKVGGDFPLYLNRGEPVRLNGRVWS